MLFWKSKEKEFKMIWEVLKDARRSYLVGTAHFFPYSFKKTFRRYLTGARTVVFEGPLDEENMTKVVRAGSIAEDSYHLFDELDNQTIAAISDALKPSCRDPNSFFIMDLCKMRLENPIYDLVKGMKPWLAFFTIWSDYLRENGWRVPDKSQAFFFTLFQATLPLFRSRPVFDKVLMNHSQPSQLQMLKVQHNRW
jgi:hypothetical protein